jgi:hypothetical protein
MTLTLQKGMIAMKKRADKKQHNQFNNVKAFQETNEEISYNDDLKNRQPTPQPKEYDEIEY